MLIKFFPLLRLTWAADDGGAGGGATSTGEGGDAGASPEPGQNSATGGADDSPGNDPSFTQTDVDRIAAKARRKAVNSFLSDLGLQDTNELKTILQQKRDADEAAKSDLEKAQAKIEQLQSQAKLAEAKAYKALLRAKFETEATEKINDVELAYLAASDMNLFNGEAGLVEVNLDAGTVSGMDEVINQLLDKRPVLRKTSTAQAPTTDGAAGGNTPAAGRSEAEQSRILRTYGIRRQRG